MKPNLSLCWVLNVIVIIEEDFIEEFEDRHEQTKYYNDSHKLRSTSISKINSKSQWQYILCYITIKS